jgi:hypothetical protein
MAPKTNIGDILFGFEKKDVNNSKQPIAKTAVIIGHPFINQ